MFYTQSTVMFSIKVLGLTFRQKDSKFSLKNVNYDNNELSLFTVCLFSFLGFFF